jgi:hypothetical protein
MFTFKHLKTLQHVSIIIQTIFRKLVNSCKLYQRISINYMIEFQESFDATTKCEL